MNSIVLEIVFHDIIFLGNTDNFKQFFIRLYILYLMSPLRKNAILTWLSKSKVDGNRRNFVKMIIGSKFEMS